MEETTEGTIEEETVESEYEVYVPEAPPEPPVDEEEIEQEESIPLPTQPEVPSPIVYLVCAKPKTQKARGIRTLVRGSNYPTTTYLKQHYAQPLFISSKVSIDYFTTSRSKVTFRKQLLKLTDGYNWISHENLQIMARPCPTVPRHGFVESRVVTCMKELRKVIEQTRAEDPRGEVLLVPFIEAERSAVITESAVSVGPGNDGATAGKQSIAIPCISNLRAALQNLAGEYTPKKEKLISGLAYAGFKPVHRGVYLEVVNNYCVQLRYGPKADAALDKFPPVGWQSFYCVDQLWMPSKEDLKDFKQFEELLLDKLIKKSGYCKVLYLPGSTLSSHAAVQAISYGLGVVCGNATQPIIGEFYNFSKPIFTCVGHSEGAKAVSLGAQYGAGVKLDLPQDQLNELAWAVAIIQCMATSHDTKLKLGLTMAAAAIIIRYGYAACYGEHRRFYQQGPGSQEGAMLTSINHKSKYTSVKYFHYPYPTIYAGDPGRSLVQQNFLKYNIADRSKIYELVGWAKTLEYDFRKGTWLQGFGGERWAECTRLVTDLYLAWLEQYNAASVTNKMCTIRTTAIVQAANRFITQCHNGGKCLSKFIGKQTFDLISTAPGFFVTYKFSLDLASHITYGTPLQFVNIKEKKEEKDGSLGEN